MLFVYVGTKIVEFSHEVADEFCTLLMQWDSPISRSKTLKQTKTHEYATISKDISSLHVNFGYSKSPGKFGRVKESGDTAIYFYQHVSYITFSSVTCTKLVGCLGKNGIVEKVDLVYPCVSTNCHAKASYYPYFYGDKQCETLVTSLATTGHISPEECKSLRDQFRKISDKLSVKVRAVNALSYQEDDWTERLHHCLEYNKIASQLTARLRGNAVSESWVTRISSAVSFDSLLFKGAPDLIIAGKVDGIVVNENLPSSSHMPSSQEEENDSQEENEEDLPSSQGSSRIQVGHQMPSFTPYKGGSLLYDKVGELVGALLNSVACRVFRKYEGGEKVVSLTAFHVKITLSRKVLEVTSVQLVDGLLSPELWCPTIERFIKILECGDGEELV